MKTTIVRPIPGYPGYAISKDGEVVSFVKSSRFNGPHFIKPGFDSHTGYNKVGLETTSGRRTITVHSLVARAWIGERPKGCDIDHKDGNKLNNSVDNLHYVTRKQNQLNPNNHGKVNGQLYADRKVVACKAGKEQVFDNMNQMCEALGLYSSCVCMCLSDKYPRSKSHHGYTFKWTN